jgi:amidase
MFLADGGKSIQKLLDPVQEPLRDEMKRYGNVKELGVYDMWQLQAKRTEFCKRYLDRWNACEGLDAILCRFQHHRWRSILIRKGPTTPYAGVKHGDFSHVGYTGVYNVLDYTAVSFPSGLVANEEIDIIDDKEKPLNGLCAEVCGKCK